MGFHKADATTTRFQCVGNVNMAKMMLRVSNRLLVVHLFSYVILFHFLERTHEDSR